MMMVRGPWSLCFQRTGLRPLAAWHTNCTLEIQVAFRLDMTLLPILSSQAFLLLILNYFWVENFKQKRFLRVYIYSIFILIPVSAMYLCKYNAAHFKSCKAIWENGIILYEIWIQQRRVSLATKIIFWIIFWSALQRSLGVAWLSDRMKCPVPSIPSMPSVKCPVCRVPRRAHWRSPGVLLLHAMNS